ncbi:MAG: c-type cytochrome [Pseudomonadota bacterium]
MDSSELNKIMGAVLAAFLALLLLNFAAGKIYDTRGGHHGPEQLAYALEIESGEEEEEEPEIDVLALIASADPGKGEKVFKRCAACHKLDVNGAGPMLAGVVGRDIGSVDGYSYSSGLANAEGNWDAESLFAFLGNPKEWNSSMSVNFKKEADRAAVIKYLEGL